MRAGRLALRLILQPPAGFLLGGAVSYASLFPLFLLSLPFCAEAILEGPPSKGCDIYFYVGLTVGAAVGAGIGVTAIGTLLASEGQLSHTLMGGLVGAVTGSILVHTLPIMPEDSYRIIVGPALVAALAATVAFTISDALAPPPKGSAFQGGTGFSVLPVVSATRTGGFVGGLSGRF